MDGEPEIKWRVVRKAKAYTPESKRCLSCLAEKFEPEIKNHCQVQTPAETSNNFLPKKWDVERQCQ